MKGLLFGLAFVLLAPAGLAAEKARDADSHFFQPSFRDLPEELKLARTEGKRGLVIFFEAEDCPPCKRMKRDILSQPRVQDYYRRHFRVLSIDFNGDLEVVDPAGRAFVEKSFAGKDGVAIRGTPSLLFLDLQGGEMTRHYGEIRKVEDFLLLGKFVVSGAWRSSDFVTYRARSQ